MTSVLFFLLFTSFPTPASHMHAQEHLCSFTLLPQPSLPVPTGGRQVTWYPRVSHCFFHSRQLEMVTHTGWRPYTTCLRITSLRPLRRSDGSRQGDAPESEYPLLQAWIHAELNIAHVNYLQYFKSPALLSQSIDESWSDGCNNSCQF